MPLNKQQTKLLLAILTLLGFFGLIGLLLFVAIPSENADIVKVFAGFLGASFVNLISHYFRDENK